MEKYCYHCNALVDIDECDTDSYWTNDGDRVVFEICPFCGESVLRKAGQVPAFLFFWNG